MIELKKNEQIEDLHCENYKIIQNKEMFCFGIDAVLLANFAKVGFRDKAVDLCCGNGIIPILLHAKSKCDNLIGVDIIEENIFLAKKSCELNNIKINFINADLKNITEILEKQIYDVVTVNPPYMANDTGLKNIKDAKTIARHEVLCNLDDIIKNSSNLLKYGGKFYMVHRPNRLAEIFYTMKKYDIEPKLMQLVQPFKDKEPNIVLIEGIKNGKPNLIIKNNLIVYDDINVYTKEMSKVYE